MVDQDQQVEEPTPEATEDEPSTGETQPEGGQAPAGE